MGTSTSGPSSLLPDFRVTDPERGAGDPALLAALCERLLASSPAADYVLALRREDDTWHVACGAPGPTWDVPALLGRARDVADASAPPARISDAPPVWLMVLAIDDELVGALLSASAPSADLPGMHEALALALHDRRRALGADHLHRSYELARAILQEVSTGLITVDGSGRVTFLNRAAEAVLGVSLADAVGADGVRVFRTFSGGRNVLLEGLDGARHARELWIRRRDGRDVPVRLALSPLRGRSGEAAGVLGVFEDMSEHRSLEERVRHRDRLATVGELAAGIAHEIGNPLTGIRNCAQILRDRVGDVEGARELVAVILEEVDRLGRLSNQVRHYVRPGTPRMKRRSVAETLDPVLAVMAAQAEEVGVAVLRRDAPDLPDIYHDPDQIKQVLLNLVQNAIDAMRDGGGRLDIDCRRVRRSVATGPSRARRQGDDWTPESRPAEREFVRVRVSDTGAGVSEEALGRIFNPFFTTKPDGLGLGLSISQTIVGEHGGFLSVVSREGKGTTFILDLPVDRRAR